MDWLKVFAGAVLVSLVLQAAPSWAGSDRPDFSLHGSYRYGPVHGYVQTPSGGAFGTTDAKRPTLTQAGIDRASLFDFGAEAAWGRARVFAGGEIGRLSGSNTLEAPLLTHAETFAEGTRVSTDIKTDWYRGGVGYDFPLGRAGDWTVTPKVAVAVLDFSYHIEGGGLSTGRAYIKPTFQLGADLNWAPNGGRFSIGLGLMATPPVRGLPWIDQVSLEANYRLIDSRAVDATVSAGVSFERIEFEDGQTVPNHIRIDYGPMLVLGLNLQF